MASVTFTPIRSARGRIGLLIATSVLAGAAGIANAATPAPVDAVPSVAVSYSDLNIASAEGARTLYTRIAAAARQVCPLADARDAEQVVSTHACRDAAIARAVHDINSPQLAALQAEHDKRG